LTYTELHITLSNVKLARPYRMLARAASSAETGRRIVSAMLTLFVERPYDCITLDEVAAHAGVTRQTVIRRFESKEGLLAAAVEDGRARVAAQRFEAPVGDVRGAVRNLFDHYEEWASVALRLLEQEERVAVLAPVTRDARQVHLQWVERTFAPFLRGGGPMRLAQLATLTDVYVWKLLRRDQQLSRCAAEECLVEMIEAMCVGGE